MRKAIKAIDWVQNLRWPEFNTTDLQLCEGDLFIFSLGFEDRATHYIQKQLESGAKFDLIPIAYAPFIDKNKEFNLDLCNAQVLCNPTYDRLNPEYFSDDLFCHIDPVKHRRVIIDVSAMSRLLIIQLIQKFLTSEETAPELFVLYTEAESYYPSEAEAVSKEPSNYEFSSIQFLSSGVFDVAVLPELSAITSPNTEILLLAFPSFDQMLLTSVVNEIQPKDTILAYGLPPNAKNRWRLDYVQDIHKKIEPPHSKRYDLSTFDYTETLKLILAIYEKYRHTHKIIVSPTGSKLQTVGVAIAKSVLKEIQVVYPIAEGFESPLAYSESALDSYSTSISLFNYTQFRARILEENFQ